MVIVLIYWRIKPDPESIDAFQKFWKEDATIEDRTGLIGEFLCEAESFGARKWITWNLGPAISENDGADDKETFRAFINVGLWKSVDTFNRQVGGNFNDNKKILHFEQKRRLRVLLNPKVWRMGDFKLPIHDSGGVK